uniref:Transposase n=1 Tax=Streptomyces sp. NBC_01401 TaxID=2903854 RepID=A0AAU3GVL9_9ACTN
MANLKPYTDQVSDAYARLTTGMRTLRCPVPGCTLRIRYRHVTPDEDSRLVALAHDHTRHDNRK